MVLINTKFAFCEGFDLEATAKTLVSLRSLGLGVLSLSSLLAGLLLLLLVVLGRNDDTTTSDGDLVEELGEFLVLLDSNLDVTRVDTSAAAGSSSVTSELENLSAEVLEDSSEVDGSASTDALSVLTLLQEAANTTNGECETSLSGAGDDLAGLGLATTALTLAFACRGHL